MTVHSYYFLPTISLNKSYFIAWAVIIQISDGQAWFAFSDKPWGLAKLAFSTFIFFAYLFISETKAAIYSSWPYSKLTIGMHSYGSLSYLFGIIF